MTILIEKPILLAVTGPIYAGKRAYVEYISSRLSCTEVYSLSAFAAFDSKMSSGHVINSENKAEIREYMNTMRHLYGNAYFVKGLKLDKIVNRSVVFVRSLKNATEIEFFRSIGGIVVGIDASKEVRYKRSQMEEPLKGYSFDYFKELEASEFPDLDKCLALSNFIITNEEVDFKKSPSKFYLGPCSDMLNDLSRKFPYFDADKSEFDPAFIAKVNNEDKIKMF